VKHCKLSYLLGILDFAIPETMGGVSIPDRKIQRSKLLLALALGVMSLGLAIPSFGQETTIFNCSSGFSSSGACGTNDSGSDFSLRAGSTIQLVGSQIELVTTGAIHVGNTAVYTTLTNDQAFRSTFTFVPNGMNIVFVLENTSNDPGWNGAEFSQGAGCEAGFFQSLGTPPLPPNNVFGVELDSYSPLTQGGSFTYSSTQMYIGGQSPCIPIDPAFWPTAKISTSPVPLNNPVSSQNTTTGDTYSATITYTGTTLTEQLYNVTAGGSCPGSSCFTYTWTNVDIPSIVNGTTAYPVLSGGTGLATSYPLYVNSWAYNVLSPAATPTFSLAAGTYSGTQSVTISDSTSSSYICYNFTGAPATNGIGGCANGTLYSGAVSVPSGATLYAVAGVSQTYGDSSVGSATYNITGTGSVPTFNQPGGTWQGHQTVQLTAAQGGVICYNTTGSPATNGSTGCTTGTQYTAPITVSSNETIYAVAGGTGFSDSSVGSAAYVISPYITGGYVPANAPTLSPLPGTYSGTQSVSISSTTSGSYICYTVDSTPPTKLTPQVDNIGGCTTGTLYSGPVSIPSTATVYAMTGMNLSGNNLGGPPSSLVQGQYTIGSVAQTPGAPTITQVVAVAN
jgi:hypothetical protein